MAKLPVKIISSTDILLVVLQCSLVYLDFRELFMISMHSMHGLVIRNSVREDLSWAKLAIHSDHDL